MPNPDMGLNCLSIALLLWGVGYMWSDDIGSHGFI